MIGGQIRHPRHLFPPLKESKGSSSQQADLRAGFMKHNLPKCNKFFFLQMLSRQYSAGRKIIEVVISAVPHPTLTPVALKAFPSTAFAINFFPRVSQQSRRVSQHILFCQIIYPRHVHIVHSQSYQGMGVKAMLPQFNWCFCSGDAQ